MKLRLKDLSNISSEKIDFLPIMTELLGFKKKRFGRSFSFKKAFRRAYYMVKDGREIDVEKCVLNPESKIKPPSHIDYLTFKAMMELQATLGESVKTDDVTKLIGEVITIACYSENNEGEYLSEGELRDKFNETIFNSPLVDMLGLYNHICKTVEKSREVWEERFLSVQVEDKEYEQAGGRRMDQFNVMNTIKALCADFNCGYDEAWQMPYALTQTNSYSKATYNHIQDNMRQIKELKMKRERGRSPN